MKLESNAQNIELFISSRIKMGEPLELIALHLCDHYSSMILSLEAFQRLAIFLVKIGSYQTLIDFTIQKLGDGSEIPWGHIGEAIERGSSQEVPDSVKDRMIEIAEREKSLDLLTTSSFWHHRLEIISTKNTRMRMALQKAAARITELEENIELFKIQNLLEQEEQVLNLLQFLQPENPKWLQLKMSLKDRKAQDLILKRERTRKSFLLRQSRLSFIERHDLPTQKVIDALAQSMIEILRNHHEEYPNLFSDFAVALILVEAYDKAIKILENAPRDFNHLTLAAECLLLDQRYLELMELLEEMEKMKNLDADEFYAIQYLKAQGLWALDFHQEAITLLSQLLEVQPHYRSAESLLTSWREEPL